MRAIIAFALTASLLVGAPAAADMGDLIGPDRFTGVLDFRLGAADGERSWLDGGNGKARFGGGDGDFEADAELAEASLVWRPRITWSVDGYVHAQFNDHQNNTVDLVEAFVRWTSPPRDGWSAETRAGLFYPPVSLEHEETAWATRYSITPSAINSWIGEEVKVAGLEGSLSRDLGEHELGVTLGAFGRNDTSGTLLSWRGWALHDLKVGWDTDYPLPDGAVTNLESFIPWQAPVTDPHRELDERVGFYGRADWRAPELISINVVHYDNAGSRAKLIDGHYAWETRFTDIGVTLDVSPDTIVLFQAMTGETIMGRRSPWRVDVGYAAAYGLANHTVGDSSFTARIDWFTTTDRTFVAEDNNNEEGWALTGAYGRDISERHRLQLEAMRISSDRAGRLYGGGDPEQDQTVLQASWRITL